ncbi:haloacid dehalogenase type II [Oceanicella sp. SM1341]|uniref:haloacid dehalogenase type II n=1 Tax=Oceanicella sp. SM1341 TaxID=1548889 RepID=UPI000E53EFD2|nr:haloacid dehalogenase type II [Oceanicella sp. SM1341]
MPETSPAPRRITTCVFDAYGTLFDVTAAARACAAEPGREALAAVAPRLAETWRLKQLQYSWLRAVTGAHADFWQVTGEALAYAMEEAGLGEDPALAARLMDLYRELDAYTEVPAMLAALKSAGLATAILSNGAPEMLASAVASAGIGQHLDAVLSVEDVGVFKPARAVYDLVGRRFGTAPAEVLFVSSNGWDAAAASGYGFTTLWVNRAGLPQDRLPWAPRFTAPDLTTVPDIAARA